MIQAKDDYERNPSAKLEKDISKFNNIQMARKIQLNSAYGAIGNQYFRYYNLRNAEAITYGGQFSIRWIENKMNVYLNKILKLKEKIMSLLVILIVSTSIWVLWSRLYTRGERKLMRALSRSLIRSVKWNLSLIFKVLTKNWLSMSVPMTRR